ncbi:hypothetical protein ANN_20128, partial [Periplaneta americana]
TRETINDSNVDLISIEELESVINKCKSRKAPGSDRINTELFKHAPTSFLHKFLDFLNICWTSGQIPDEWTESIVVPIHKKGNHKNCNNYRGVSLLNSGYKIYANIITNRLNTITETLIREEQNGFRQNRSCMDSLLLIMDVDIKLAKFQQLLRTIKSTLLKKVRPETILKFYKVMTVPTLLYGSETWSSTKGQLRRIEAAEMRLLRPLAGYTLYDHKRNPDIRTELNIIAITDTIESYRNNWYEHLLKPQPDWLNCRKIGEGVHGKVYKNTQNNCVVKVLPIGPEQKNKVEDIVTEVTISSLSTHHLLRMPNNRLPKRLLDYTPHDKRDIGTPRKRWKDQLSSGSGTGLVNGEPQKKFAEILSEIVIAIFWFTCKKIGGVHGEVYVNEENNSVVKIIPIGAEYQNKVEDILTELIISLDVDTKLAKFQQLLRTIKSTLLKKVRPETILKFYEVMTVPALLYGSETWSSTKGQLRRIEAAEMRLLRPLAGYTLYDHKRNPDIRTELNIIAITDTIESYRNNWYEHLLKPQPDWLNCRKIGEGVHGKVYKNTQNNCVVKVLPIGPEQKNKVEDIVTEVTISSFWLDCKKIGEGVHGKVYKNTQTNCVLKVLPIGPEYKNKVEDIVTEVTISIFWSDCKKIGEGVHGKVYKNTQTNCVLKVLPIGPEYKNKVEDIVTEVTISIFWLNCVKIGEGVHGKVYKNTQTNCVVKVLPIGPEYKNKVEDIVTEVTISIFWLNCVKIGEGVHGKVYKNTQTNCVVKVLPIGPEYKNKVEDIVTEVTISIFWLNCVKIGEGVHGKVYKNTQTNCVLKVLPIGPE